MESKEINYGMEPRKNIGMEARSSIWNGKLMDSKYTQSPTSPFSESIEVPLHAITREQKIEVLLIGFSEVQQPLKD
jgi:hypothetical protein